MPNLLLIISDHQVRSKVRTLLEDANLPVRDSMAAPMGVQMLQQEKANVIVADEKPGGMSVEELIRDIKRISPEQSIVVLLENHSMQRALELMALGVYDCMEPSFGSVELIGVVRKVLGRFDSVPTPSASAKPFWWKNKWFWIASLSSVLLVSGFRFYLRWSRSQEKQKQEIQNFANEKEFSLPYPHPSGISYDGENFWVCDWFTQSIYRHKQSGAFEILSVHHFADINPVAIAWSGVVLWAVSTDGKIQKHALDEKLTLLNSVKSPGPNPSGIAFDGNYLWSADAGLKKIFKHLPDEKLTVLAEFLYPGDAPVGLFWDGANLWSVDGVRKVLLRHRIDGNRLLVDEVKQFSRYRDPEFKLVGATFDGKRFWSLSENPARVVRHALQE